MIFHFSLVLSLIIFLGSYSFANQVLGQVSRGEEFFEAGLQLFNSEQYDSALVYFNRALELDSKITSE